MFRGLIMPPAAPLGRDRKKGWRPPTLDENGAQALAKADLLHDRAIRAVLLDRPSKNDLGGDPSAGSPTDTLFTFSPCRHGAWTVTSSEAMQPSWDAMIPLPPRTSEGISGARRSASSRDRPVGSDCESDPSQSRARAASPGPPPSPACPSARKTGSGLVKARRANPLPNRSIRERSRPRPCVYEPDGLPRLTSRTLRCRDPLFAPRDRSKPSFPASERGFGGRGHRPLRAGRFSVSWHELSHRASHQAGMIDSAAPPRSSASSL